MGCRFRYYGVNYVVTRYPKNPAPNFGVPISEVVGSISDLEKDTKFIRDNTAKTHE